MARPGKAENVMATNTLSSPTEKQKRRGEEQFFIERNEMSGHIHIDPHKCLNIIPQKPEGIERGNQNKEGTKRKGVIFFYKATIPPTHNTTTTTHNTTYEKWKAKCMMIKNVPKSTQLDQ